MSETDKKSVVEKIGDWVVNNAHQAIAFASKVLVGVFLLFLLFALDPPAAAWITALFGMVIMLLSGWQLLAQPMSKSFPHTEMVRHLKGYKLVHRVSWLLMAGATVYSVHDAAASGRGLEPSYYVRVVEFQSTLDDGRTLGGFAVKMPDGSWRDASEVFGQAAFDHLFQQSVYGHVNLDEKLGKKQARALKGFIPQLPAGLSPDFTGYEAEEVPAGNGRVAYRIAENPWRKPCPTNWFEGRNGYATLGAVKAKLLAERRRDDHAAALARTGRIQDYWGYQMSLWFAVPLTLLFLLFLLGAITIAPTGREKLAYAAVPLALLLAVWGGPFVLMEFDGATGRERSGDFIANRSDGPPERPDPPDPPPNRKAARESEPKAPQKEQKVPDRDWCPSTPEGRAVLCDPSHRGLPAFSRCNCTPEDAFDTEAARTHVRAFAPSF